MPGSRSAGRVAAVVLLAIASVGCIAPVASSSSAPGSSSSTAGPSATRTLNPNEAARASAGATPTPTPVPTAPPSLTATSPTPRPSPPPKTEMELLLPIPSGGGNGESGPLTASDLTDGGNETIRMLLGMLARLDRSPFDLQAAATRGNVIDSVLDLRIDGVDPNDLADAYIAASRAATPDAKVTRRTVEGLSVRHLRWTGGYLSDADVVVVNGIVYAFTGQADQAPYVDATIGFLSRPRLDLLLPAELAGHPVLRQTFPASAVLNGGDICSLVCPGEPDALAKAIGVSVRRIDMAYLYATEAPGALIVAFRVPGATSRRLIEARITLGGSTPFGREDRKIGGKTVTWVAHDPFPLSSQSEYLYAHDHVLYSIRPAVDEGPPNVAVIEAIRALP